MVGVLKRRGQLRTQKKKKRLTEKTACDNRDRCIQKPKNNPDCWQPPAAARRHLPQTLWSLTADLQPQNIKIIHPCSFKPPGVWSFVTAAQETNTLSLSFGARPTLECGHFGWDSHFFPSLLRPRVSGQCHPSVATQAARQEAEQFSVEGGMSVERGFQCDLSITDFVVVQLLSCIRFFTIPQTIACQAPVSMEFSRQEY